MSGNSMTLPPLPEPCDYCYEWETGYGIVRKFSATPHHGMPPTRAVALYTADQMRAALAAVPAQPVSDELIESLWFDAQRAWGEQTSVHPGEHVLFARLLERRIAAAPQAVPVVNQQLTTEAQAVPVPAAPPMPQPAGQVEVFEPWISTRKVAHGFKRRVDVFLLEQIEERDRQWLAMLAAGPKEQP